MLCRHVQYMARYHRWATESLFEASAAASDEAYRSDSGLFFRSIHGTWVHLVLGERVWHARITGADASDLAKFWSCEPREIEEYIADRDRLREELLRLCDAWVEMADSFSKDEDLVATFDYHDTSGNRFTAPYISALTQVFNHGTHHRGQITAAMTHAGLAFPPLDMQRLSEAFSSFAGRPGTEA